MKSRALLVGFACACLLLAGCAYERQQEERDAKLVQIRTDLAAGFFERGELAYAKDEVSKALALNPDDSEANNVMALIQARLGHDKEADHYFRKALSANPENAGAENDYAIYLCQKGHVDQAMVHFKHVINDPLYPSPQRPNLNAGVCLVSAHQEAAARPYLERALVLQPNFAPALYELAQVDFADDRLAAASDDLTHYFATGAESADALLLGVKLAKAMGDVNQQATYALRLSAKYPHSPQDQEAMRLAGPGAQGRP